jgi:flagellar biosynthesis/type III secretory pathway protein FliH
VSRPRTQAGTALEPPQWPPLRDNRSEVASVALDRRGVARGRPSAGDPKPFRLPALSTEPASAIAQAFEEGRQAGHEAATLAARARVDATLTELAATLNLVIKLRTDVLARSEHEIVLLAVGIAERILNTHLRTDPTHLLRMAQSGLRTLGDGRVATLYLNPADFEVIMSRCPLDGQHAITLEPDPGLPAGGGRLATTAGVMNLGVDAQLQEILRVFIDRGPTTDAGPTDL